ncbi:protein FAR1-RELATED SEQUENCE 5-like [Dioscorea cayenensis subsp. rotundata]|uniref:Protein FAR1-RELATED SEQUENCE n=1 Tax=Dioscorea cayennensis subsp. rotundata TaxID=55577 RepID=A0AB40AZJ9_DIOCR|nr:protein FAR1-RELATED SEQUENCE 5-like [Dioscorea cayenensis subsp. rotundata]XP_039120443.1 protein FAR1-RELATED SEQUENCE 5-like [Dioscorea cayenensis subsp. rotundata]XP_039120444.1 protein FAR1-RELATED SEQUENCE 5-like [Dioscorea cayenensis subsp. rotundata]
MAEAMEVHSPVEDGGNASWVPKVDMEFKSDEDAYKFYNNYAKQIGFSVRKAWINRRISGTIISRTYVCYKEGYQGNRKDETVVTKPRVNERTGCLAHLTIKIVSNGSYRVSEFHPMHNHELVPSTKAYLLKSHRIKKSRTLAGKLVPRKGAVEYLFRGAGVHRQVAFISVEEAASKSWAPKIDMEFENDEKAYEFYNNYAKKIGFGVRKAWVNRKASGIIVSRTYVCYKEGYNGNKKDGNQVKKHQARPTERTGCPARMMIKLTKNGRYHVTLFHSLHNHEFVMSKMLHTLKSCRDAAKSLITAENEKDDWALQPEVIHEVVDGQDEIRKNPSCFLKYENSSHTKRKVNLKLGDAGAIMQYMQERQADDPSFYYAMQVDKEDQITNVFWADSKSIIDFSYFGDVICFDMTYKTNGYSRPFTSFLGINHHRQLIVFGAAFLCDESAESFKWLADTFKTAMYGKQPKVILTDQNLALSEAVASVWPGTTCRVCVWHIYNNAKKYLKQVFQGSRTFASAFSRCVFDCVEEDEFILAWEEMLDKYDLRGNQWLSKLFDDRKEWSLAYSRDTFCADIRSALRKETLICMLKEHLGPEKGLLQFLRHFERVVYERRQAELQADFHATQNTLKIVSSRMLKQASSMYTPPVFEMFQSEFEMSMDCMVHCSGEFETIYEYQVTSDENPKEHVVRFDSLESTLLCSCKKFEFSGIQCRHVLKALDIINIKELPPQYFLKRWTKDARGGALRDPDRLAIEADSSLFKGNRYKSLCRMFNKVAARAAETVETDTFIQFQSDQLMDQVNQILQARPPDEFQYH